MRSYTRLNQHEHLLESTETSRAQTTSHTLVAGGDSTRQRCVVELLSSSKEHNSVVLSVNGRIVRIAQTDSGSSTQLVVNGHSLEVRHESELQRKAGLARQRSPTGTIRVLAPLPGRVLTVSVRAGEQVAAGAVLLCIEAMKMENELRSPVNAFVSAVHVEEGDTVETNGQLLTLETATD